MPTEVELLIEIRDQDAAEYAANTAFREQVSEHLDLWNVEIGLLCALLLAYGLNSMLPRW